MLLVGAKAGAEQLPPFPEPDHRSLPSVCGGVNSRTPRNYQNCEVNFLSAASRRAAHPPVCQPLSHPLYPREIPLHCQILFFGRLDASVRSLPGHRARPVSPTACVSNA